ncbi:hypothetical protein LX83_000485 [Goodfellowiella coeruleoviolacea]|uniref:Uncharacterized protein n=1 Tax=Goodfellowiella coeruleoviolacea TaxID=334858 RepID=A0AAE3G8R1_9PSEU|nr:hypothetical protein [Goodfellowiella coeruleoviolacea]
MLSLITKISFSASKKIDAEGLFTSSYSNLFLLISERCSASLSSSVKTPFRAWSSAPSLYRRIFHSTPWRISGPYVSKILSKFSSEADQQGFTPDAVSVEDLGAEILNSHTRRRIGPAISSIVFLARLASRVSASTRVPSISPATRTAATVPVVPVVARASQGVVEPGGGADELAAPVLVHDLLTRRPGPVRQAAIVAAGAHVLLVAPGVGHRAGHVLGLLRDPAGQVVDAGFGGGVARVGHRQATALNGGVVDRDKSHAPVGLTQGRSAGLTGPDTTTSSPWRGDGSRLDPRCARKRAGA